MLEPTSVVPADPENQGHEVFAAVKARAQKPVVTFALIAINLLVFVAGAVASPGFLFSPTTKQLLDWGANFAPLTLHGQSWRLITACFLHIGVIHIVMNMFILLQVGVFAEMLFGKARFLLLYLLAGLWGSVASVAAHPPIVSAGASGAVFGVYGAVLAYLLVQRHVVPSAQARAIAKSAGIFIVYNLIYGLARPGIDIRAHIGGLVAGFLVGAGLALPLSPEGQKFFPVRSATVAVLAVGVAWLSLKGMSAAVTPKDELIQQIVSGKSVSDGKNNKVIYSGSSTETEARSLAQALATGYFSGKGAVAFLSRGADGVTITFLTGDKDPTKPGDGSAPKPDNGPHLVPPAWNDPDVLARTRSTGISIASSVGGPPLNIALLTSDGVLEKVIRVDMRVAKIGTGDSVWYSEGTSLDDAQALGKAMQTIGYFHNTGGRVLLAKNGANYDVSFAVRDGSWDDPKVVALFQVVGRKLSQALGGQPVRMHLVDHRLEPKKDL